MDEELKSRLVEILKTTPTKVTVSYTRLYVEGVGERRNRSE